MSKWDNYQREERANLGAGDYRCAITNAYEDVAKTSGKAMIVVEVQPNGAAFTVKHYIVEGEYFNRNMTSLFDCFPEIGDGNFDLLSWIGCIGAARFKQDGNYLRVHYFLTPEQARHLPEWEGARPERQQAGEMPKNEDDEELPF